MRTRGCGGGCPTISNVYEKVVEAANLIESKTQTRGGGRGTQAALPHRTRPREGGACEPSPNARRKRVQVEMRSATLVEREVVVAGTHSANMRHERSSAGTGARKPSSSARCEREEDMADTPTSNARRERGVEVGAGTHSSNER